MRALGPRFWLAALRFPITRPVGLVFANSSIAAASLPQPFRTYPSTAARFWIERWCDGCGICPARHARGFNRISLIGLIADPLDRSEGRRVGQEWVLTCGFSWSRYH